MKKIILFAFFLTISFTTIRADDLQELQGKWIISKKNENGQSFKQSLEIVKNKLTFKIVGDNNEVRLVALAELELKKLGTFKSIHLANLRAGDSESNANAVDEDYSFIYIITEDGLALAANFDKQHEDKKPTVDIYKKAN